MSKQCNDTCANQMLDPSRHIGEAESIEFFVYDIYITSKNI